jgi:hypothetical protein
MGNDNKSRVPKLDPKELKRARDEGFEEGLTKGRQEILDWLQRAYLDDPGRPDRGTPKAEAILEMASAASLHFQKRVKGRARR